MPQALPDRAGTRPASCTAAALATFASAASERDPPQPPPLPPDRAAACGSTTAVDVRALAASERFRTPTGRAAFEEDANWRLAAAVLDLAGAALVVVDEGGEIRAANVHFCATHGYAARELEGVPLNTVLRDLGGGDGRPGVGVTPLPRLCALGGWRGEALLRRQGGQLVGVKVDIKAVWDGSASPRWFIVRTERTSRPPDATATNAMDTTTGLPRWGLLRAILGRKLEEAAARGGRVAVMLIDALNLRTVDRALGHVVGRRLRSRLARRLNLALPRRDTLSRLTGDTFGLVCSDLADRDAVTAVAEQALRATSQPFVEGDKEIHIGVRIGIAMVPDDARTVDELLQHAEIALSSVPEGGQGGYRFFASGMQDRLLRRVSIESALRGALERREFHLVYQPRIDLATRRVCGAEALLRWTHPDLGVVSPAEFVPVAEDIGVIEEVGAWVLREACRQHGEWRAAGVAPPQLSVNLSGVQLRSPALVGTIAAALRDSGTPADALELELTESVLMADVAENRTRLADLHGLGVRLAVDDFGTGYSSLAYLQRFPVDVLKVDRSFVAGLPDDRDSAAIVAAIVHMARALSLAVVAEGVETPGQLQFLADLGCAEVQGFLFGKGVDGRSFAQRFGR